MKITTVGSSERQYFQRGEEKAYITLNSPQGYNVYTCRRSGTGNFVKTYKTLVGAQRFLTAKGFAERI